MKNNTILLQASFVLLALLIKPICVTAASDVSRKASILFQKGNNCFLQKKYDRASQFYEDAFTKDPELLDALFNQARSEELAGRIDNAITLYSQYLDKKPKDPTAHVNLGNILETQGNPTAAIMHYQEALTIDPSFAPACNNMALLHLEEEKPELALKLLETFMREHTSPAYMDVTMGNALLKLGEINKAINAYDTALSKNPKQVYAYINKAEAYLLKRKPAFALSILNEALNYSKTDPAIFTKLGDAYTASGDKEKALHSYEKALQLAAEDTAALAVIKEKIDRLHKNEYPAPA